MSTQLSCKGTSTLGSVHVGTPLTPRRSIVPQVISTMYLPVGLQPVSADPELQLSASGTCVRHQSLVRGVWLPSALASETRSMPGPDRPSWGIDRRARGQWRRPALSSACRVPNISRIRAVASGWLMALCHVPEFLGKYSCPLCPMCAAVADNLEYKYPAFSRVSYLRLTDHLHDTRAITPLSSC